MLSISRKTNDLDDRVKRASTQHEDSRHSKIRGYRQSEYIVIGGCFQSGDDAARRSVARVGGGAPTEESAGERCVCQQGCRRRRSTRTHTQGCSHPSPPLLSRGQFPRESPLWLRRRVARARTTSDLRRHHPPVTQLSVSRLARFGRGLRRSRGASCRGRLRVVVARRRGGGG